MKHAIELYVGFLAFVRKSSFYAATDILVFRFTYFKGTNTHV